MENYLMYGIVILGVIGVVLNIALILVYVIAIKELDSQQRKYKNEMRRLNQEQDQTQREIERLTK